MWFLPGEGTGGNPITPRHYCGFLWPLVKTHAFVNCLEITSPEITLCSFTGEGLHWKHFSVLREKNAYLLLNKQQNKRYSLTSLICFQHLLSFGLYPSAWPATCLNVITPLLSQDVIQSHLAVPRTIPSRYKLFRKSKHPQYKEQSRSCPQGPQPFVPSI